MSDDLQQTPPPNPRRAPRWRQALAGTLILLFGVIIGAGLMSRAMWLRDPFTMFDPKTLPDHVARLIDRQLDLDPDQSAKLRALLQRHTAEVEVVRAKIRPEMDILFDQFRAEVESILTPTQAATWNQKYYEMQRRWRPGAPPPRPRGSRGIASGSAT